MSTTQRPISKEILDLEPPNDPEAEMGVLGSMMFDAKVIDDVAEIIRAEHFHNAGHGTLFDHLVGMHADGTPMDIRLVLDRLRLAGDLEAVGGPGYIGEIFDREPYAANAMYYARIVLRKAKYRAVIHATTQALKDAYTEEVDPDDLIAETENALGHIAQDHDVAEAVDAATVIETALDRARKLKESGRGAGLSTGFADFDWHIGGLFPGELVILAARPRMGKTAMATQMMVNCATRGHHVLFISAEMSGVELSTRLLCARAGVDSSRIRTGTLTDADLGALETAAEQLRSAAFQIDDRPAVSVDDIRRAAGRQRRKGGIDLVIVDYLQRVVPADPRAKRHEQVGRMAGELKRLARELDRPVLVLAQLNREVESSPDHRPRLSHLRESGDIEADADVVAFLHREEVYKPNDADVKGKALLIVEKNRNGPAGEFPLLWQAETTTFRTPTPEWDQWPDDATDAASTPRQGSLEFAP